MEEIAATQKIQKINRYQVGGKFFNCKKMRPRVKAILQNEDVTFLILERLILTEEGPGKKVQPRAHAMLF